MVDNTLKHQWSDSQLIAAVAASSSWRGLMRALGFPPTSPKTILRIKRDVARLGLDTTHFTGKRSWTDDQLRHALAKSATWSEVFAELGLEPSSGDARVRVKAHSVRLGLDTSRFESPQTIGKPSNHKADLKYLRDAATSMAASWFALRGFNAAIPLEPTVYDLLVTMPEGIRRVQVKTTTYCGKDGWQVGVGRRPYSIGNREGMVPYDPDLIDVFFIVDGDLTLYIIPSRVIAGRVNILLRTYKKYIVGSAAGLMPSRALAA